MIDNPLVSIIIPSYNQGKFLKDTIESCLNQDYRPLEILVVDGASTDQTLDVLHEYDKVPEIKWVSEPDNGVVDAVNKGLCMAKGEIAGIQSSDDGYLSGPIVQAIEVFKENSKLGIVYADCVYMDENSNEIRRKKTGPYSLENFLCKNSIILQPAAFFRLDLARQVGGWDPDYFIADTEMWLRMLFQAPAKKIDAFWGIRRLHPEQRNTMSAKIIDSHKKTVKESPDLHKASNRLKRAAWAGHHFMAASYNSENNRFKQRLHYCKAALYWSPLFYSQKLYYKLFPWLGAVNRIGKKVKQILSPFKRILFDK